MDECFYCHREAVGTIRVPDTLHADEKVTVCGDCYCLIAPTLLDLQQL